jgi:hypothetical protein
MILTEAGAWAVLPSIPYPMHLDFPLVSSTTELRTYEGDIKQPREYVSTTVSPAHTGGTLVTDYLINS